jgi:hypothetical protein
LKSATSSSLAAQQGPRILPKLISIARFVKVSAGKGDCCGEVRLMPGLAAFI